MALSSNCRSGGSPLLERIEKLLPEIAARADETERERGLPADLMDHLLDAGLFRMMVPRAFGGEELDHLQACRVVEALARADGSAGWNAQIIFGFNVGICRFPKPVVQQVLDRRGDVRVRGELAPLARQARWDKCRVGHERVRQCKTPG